MKNKTVTHEPAGKDEKNNNNNKITTYKQQLAHRFMVT